MSEVVQIIVDHPHFIDPMQLRLWFKGGWDAPDVVDAAYASLKPRYQGTGIGTQMFFSLAKRASSLGFTSVISTALAGSIHTTAGVGAARGAYTCGRLGFEARLSDAQIALLPPALEHCQTVHDLIGSKFGIAFWKEHAAGTVMSFDLHKGSLSWKILRSYRRRHRLSGRLSQFVETLLGMNEK
jgi:hypothetical protein